MTFRFSGIFCLIVASILGVLLFQTSQSVNEVERNLSHVNQGLGKEFESLRILTTEWDYLNRPERLEKLTLQNLDIDDPTAEKINFVGGGADVPEPKIATIPQVKPKNLLQYVSSKKKDNLSSEAIEEEKGQEFKNLFEREGGVE